MLRLNRYLPADSIIVSDVSISAYGDEDRRRGSVDNSRRSTSPFDGILYDKQLSGIEVSIQKNV